MFCHHQKGGDCWPKVTITRFYGFYDNKTYVVICTNQVQGLSLFLGSNDSRSSLPLKEGVGDSRRVKYGIKLKALTCR